MRRVSARGEATDFKIALQSDRRCRRALPSLPATRGLFFPFVGHGALFGGNKAVPTLGICADKLDLKLSVRERCSTSGCRRMSLSKVVVGFGIGVFLIAVFCAWYGRAPSSKKYKLNNTSNFSRRLHFFRRRCLNLIKGSDKAKQDVAMLGPLDPIPSPQ